MMRIGELARIAGVSTRAIRHYHSVGVLPEPERRPNGYREYSARDLLLLVRVIRLAGLGLTLDEIRDALADDTERELRDILSDIVADLDRQSDELARRRLQIAEVMSRDENLVASPAVAVLIGRLRGAVDDVDIVRREQELLEVVEATTSGDQFALMAGQYEEFMADPARVAAARELTARFERLTSQGPDDPEVLAVSELLLAQGSTMFSQPNGDDSAGPQQDTTGWEVFLQSLTPAQRHAVTRAARRWSS